MVVKTQWYNEVPVVRDAGVPEAAARPMDDVCPWDAAPAVVSSGRTPSAESAPGPSSSSSSSVVVTPAVHEQPAAAAAVVRSSRKNSSQLDSCSSSSDVSVAIAEVSERLRKTSSIAERSSHHHPHHQHHHQHHHSPQQQQQPSSSSSSGGPGPIQRNYSVGSVQPTRVKLAETTRASVATCNFRSPQQSFDLSSIALAPAELASSMRSLHHQTSAAAELTPTRSVVTVPEEIEHQHPQQTTRSVLPFVKHFSFLRNALFIFNEFFNYLDFRTTAKAPLISISAIVGDLPEDLELPIGPDDETTTGTPDTSSDCALMSEPLTQAQSMPEVDEDTRRDVAEQPALSEDKPEPAATTSAAAAIDQLPTASQAAKPPGTTTAAGSSEQSVRGPDTQQDDSKKPADEAEAAAATPATASQEQRDNNVNEVCPWEDE